jgi:hypothetical protein
MNQRAGLLLLLALALGLLAYVTWHPRWQEQLAERAALLECRKIKPSENLNRRELRVRHARCDAMEAAFRKKWE